MSQRSLQKPMAEETRVAPPFKSPVLRGAAFRRASCALAALAASLCGGHARAGDHEVEACIASSERGQELRDDGKLIDARSEFVTCARSSCPRLLQRDCASWLSDIDMRIPSIVMSARDPAGHEIADVRVSIDGAPRLDRLDGRAVQLDPGEHLLRFERQGTPAMEQRVLLHEGEKRRVIAVRFGGSGAAPRASGSSKPGPSAPEPTASRPVPTAIFVLGGLAIAGGATFAALAQTAKGDDKRLAEICAPRCAEEDVDAVRLKLIVANSALGVGVAALGTAAVLWLVRPTQTAPASPVGVSLIPTAGGGMGMLQGSF